MKDFLCTVLKGLKSCPVIGDWLEKRPKVAVIRLSGVIGDAAMKRQGICYHRLARVIDKAFEKSGVRAVALVINSPGGAAAQSSLIAGHIRQLAGEKEIPVYAFIEDVAASGGYWLACAADGIYAQETSIVGSVGVVSASFGFEDFIARHGIHRRLHTSGAEKSFLDPFVPESKTDLERLSAIQKDIHGAFRDWVRERRGEKLSGTDRTLFEGQFWTAGPALDKGFIDGIGDLRSVLREKIGENVRFIDMNPDKGLPLPLSLFGKLETRGLSDEIIETLETRSLWSRFGL